MSEKRGLAVISGASSGLGREIAVALGKRGHAVALLGRHRSTLEPVLALAGGVGMVCECDVRDGMSVARAAESALSAFGSPEVVVPAAGLAFIAPLEETSEDDFDSILETNLRGAFLLARAFRPARRQRERSWLIGILSVAGRRGFPGWSAYCASKWGLAGLLAALREEVRGTGVRISALYPGATATPLWDGLPATGTARRCSPRQVARAVCFVSTPDSAAVEEVVVSRRRKSLSRRTGSRAPPGPPFV